MLRCVTIKLKQRFRVPKVQPLAVSESPMLKVSNVALILTSNEHQYSGSSDVSRASFPAADDAGPECHKQREEGYDEQSDGGTSHVQPGM